MKKMCEPTFEEKSYGQGGGIPVLKTIWEMFDLSLLFSQLGFQKHSGLAAWQLAFAYICGLIHNTGSTNQNAKFLQETPMLKHLLSEQIQVYFDITAKRFASLFGMFWPPFLDFGL